jgi:outer membrane lipoprotein carrier protein
MAQRVKLLTLTVSSSGAIDKMRVDETDGSVTEFGFSNIQENVPTRDADFTFAPPPGVEVVDGLAPI